MIRVLHIWEKYLPGLFDETHPYCLEKDPYSSFLVAARFVDSGKPLANTFSMEVQKRRVATNPTVWERVLLRLKSRFFWQRFNQYCFERHQELKPTVIHLHFGNTAAKLLPFLKRVKTPVIVSFYGNDASESIQRREFQKSYPKLFKRAEKVLVLCEDVKERLKKLHCPEEKITVYQLPAGIENYPYEERLPSETTRFLTCARFVEKKGYAFIFSAIDRLHKEGKKVSLTIMGYGPLKASFQALGINETSHPIRMIDTELAPSFSQTYLEALKTHDIFVLPSIRASNGDDEGGPALTLVCAQAQGLPVICTPFPGSELSVEEGVTGVFVKEKDGESLYQAMNSLLARPETWNVLGRNGSLKVQEKFSRATQLDSVWRVYQSLGSTSLPFPSWVLQPQGA